MCFIFTRNGINTVWKQAHKALRRFPQCPDVLLSHGKKAVCKATDISWSDYLAIVHGFFPPFFQYVPRIFPHFIYDSLYHPATNMPRFLRVFNQIFNNCVWKYTLFLSNRLLLCQKMISGAGFARFFIGKSQKRRKIVPFWGNFYLFAPIMKVFAFLPKPCPLRGDKNEDRRTKRNGAPAARGD